MFYEWHRWNNLNIFRWLLSTVTNLHFSFLHDVKNLSKALTHSESIWWRWACVDDGWYGRVRLIVLWGWVRLHPCFTLSKQYAQVKPAITSYTLRESYPAWQHRAPGYVSLSISFSQHHLPAALSGGAQFKSPMWFVACALPQLCYIFLLFRMHQYHQIVYAFHKTDHSPSVHPLLIFPGSRICNLKYSSVSNKSVHTRRKPNYFQSCSKRRESKWKSERNQPTKESFGYWSMMAEGSLSSSIPGARWSSLQPVNTQ